MNIPDSCKWSSKKRSRKAFEQQEKKSEGETDDGDRDDTNDRESSLLSQPDNKKQQEEAQAVAKVNPHNSNATETREHNKTATTIINDYSPKKFKTVILTSVANQSQSEQQQNNQRIELKSIPHIISEQKNTTAPASLSTKSLDLLYTNKLFEIKKRIWSDDLTQDEAEKLICDFETFRNANRPEILSKQAKDSLRETEARFTYLMSKWDTDKYSLLAMRTQT